MYCTKCGQQLDENAQYCPYCGTKVFNEEYFKRQYPLKRRSIPLAIILSIVTFGIYGLYWYYSLAKDLNILIEDDSTSPGKVLFFSIITLGLYELYWLYKAGERMAVFQYQNGGNGDSSRAFIYLILSLLGWDVIAWAFIQNDLNKYSYE